MSARPSDIAAIDWRDVLVVERLLGAAVGE